MSQLYSRWYLTRVCSPVCLITSKINCTLGYLKKFFFTAFFLLSREMKRCGQNLENWYVLTSEGPTCAPRYLNSRLWDGRCRTDSSCVARLISFIFWPPVHTAKHRGNKCPFGQGVQHAELPPGPHDFPSPSPPLPGCWASPLHLPAPLLLVFAILSHDISNLRIFFF